MSISWLGLIYVIKQDIYQCYLRKKKINESLDKPLKRCFETSQWKSTNKSLGRIWLDRYIIFFLSPIKNRKSRKTSNEMLNGFLNHLN